MPFGIATQPLKKFMPRLKLTLPGTTTPWTKAPNLLLDTLMPSLKDTELRILLILLRQTIGWNQPDRLVILPYKALMKRSGRGSEAVSGALKSLTARGLIHSSPKKPPRKFRIPSISASESERH